MSASKDYEVLNAILSALPNEKVWGGGRYAKRGEKCPQYTLKSLAERGLVEVETRRCSPWSFGPKPAPFYRPNSMTKTEYDQMDATYKAFKADTDNWTEFKARSEVVARITDRGIEYLDMLRASRI